MDRRRVPQIMQPGLKATAVSSLDPGRQTQLCKYPLDGGPADRSARVRTEKAPVGRASRRTYWLIIAQNLGQLRPNRHQSALKELTLAHAEHALLQIHIAKFQLQRLADAQCRSVEQEKQNAHGARR